MIAVQSPFEVTSEDDLARLPARAVMLDANDNLCRIVAKVPELWDKSIRYNAWDHGGGSLVRDEHMDLPGMVIWLPAIP